jgi:ATP-dependent helicase STH1/SNF2
MKQIKRKIEKDPNYSMSTLRSEMHLLWDNARTYNQEGSWVYEAADQMQEAFDKMYEDEVAAAASRAVPSVPEPGPSGATSQMPSGTSTPMFKSTNAGGGIGKIKLNLGSKMKEQAQAQATPVAAAQSVASATTSLTGDESGDDDEDDDDY